MNFKRVSTAAMALAMTASLGSAALAADLPQGWTPADGARGPMLISTNPNAGSYDKTITINDEVLEGYEYEREVPGWGSETISVKLAEIPGAPAGYLPLRAVLQADGGSAYWDADSYTSSFYYEKDMIVADFHSMSVSVNDEKVEGAKALLLEGVTYVPFSVLEKLEGVTVTDNSTDAGESYAIATPNGTPLLKLASSILETANMGRGMKSTRGTAGRIFSALAHANVNVKMIDQGSSELNIIIGVKNEDFEAAIKAIYTIFVIAQL